ncbi:uncharacterized protein TRIADDRAFT_57924 [Trichoplax adhaerens]|uniref:inositol-phosphate phosphatase n=1 Tax=Trichoplax adhaerens TaxID=10228 RepID=B3S248_TRIAD|nr:hypothetical protein TRIADDRAFT_57924 [Trichoplax adhaerens]EDV23369.1 hypothetical protein TRIADDRAFT_57924 [Trichoplax adhaerens]|eukprot:XP_002114279.1 hypothetical protein TRIADDRAFT_57924 [Trichoplax adhaerens]
MVCVAIKGKPVIGVIYNPFTSNTVWAWIGHGRSKDLISYAKLGRKSTPLDVTVSRSHAGKVNAIIKTTFGQDVRITPAGGAGYKTLSIAKNIADLYIHSTKIKKWDICAGNAILRSLGGKMTSFSGNQIDYSQADTPVHDGGIVASLPINEYSHEKFVSASGRLLDLV